MTEESIRNLAAAVTLQAVKDYFVSSTAKKQLILNDLRSNWMITLTSGMSKNVAEQLELRPEEIRARLFKNATEEEVI